MKSLSLFSPLTIGTYELKHRIVMVSLTRIRAGKNNVPQEMSVEYYRQRASNGGFIISEATQVTPYGQRYPSTPGIYSDEQIDAWKKNNKCRS